ncbi:MAG: benzoyl-CoA reductase subunit C [Deltaproteobacteria bacterium CG2_30_63_29]|nr:MAG: benzoyl-CoA reductase subunit C [Deltaproteobacteria bacterium CG2_30_63_29]PIW01989.1 MAG: benzoyl-CoA reductase subunit C [Deltaproteobacteria bacterium CG17_big_fil_post_rev_8_21_14_2_50_63_7]PJB33720.1 MAG: benzoyl-CoA reductase subunit C [Deltaproteobacteria bacterium CG_4_9_14_3_um_filter_63_12]
MTEHQRDPAQPILEKAQALVDDMFDVVAAWKKANPGGLAVGHMPIYTPRVILEAIGILPVAIFGGGDQVDIIRGDSYFQSYICQIPRSTIELGLLGRYDVLDGMIFPSICDVIRNLGGMWTLLFKDKYSAYLDLPQNFNKSIGGKFYASELRRIATELGVRGAKPLTNEGLATALLNENARRAAMASLDKLRMDEPWKVAGSEAYLIARAGSAIMAKEHTALINDFVAAAKARQTRPVDNVRVVLRGAFCEQPPIALIRSLEKAGCDIVDDDFQLGMRTIEGPIVTPENGELLVAIANAFLTQGRHCASRYIDEDEKGLDVVKRVREVGADGVIFAAASFCDPALLDQPMIEAALTRAKIPFTSFKFSENTGQFQVIREQAGAFSDAVKLWGSEA